MCAGQATNLGLFFPRPIDQTNIITLTFQGCTELVAVAIGWYSYNDIHTSYCWLHQEWYFYFDCIEMYHAFQIAYYHIQLYQ